MVSSRRADLCKRQKQAETPKTHDAVGGTVKQVRAGQRGLRVVEDSKESCLGLTDQDPCWGQPCGGMLSLRHGDAWTLQLQTRRQRPKTRAVGAT
jgi:hypothetical protein